MKAILQRRQVPDLVRTEAQLLYPLDETEALHVFRRVVPDAAREFRGFGYEPAPLLMADGQRSR